MNLARVEGRGSTAMRWVVVIIASSLLLAGCSLTMKTAPPEYRPEVHGPPDCTAGGGRAGLDTLGAIYGLGLGALGLVMAIVEDDEFYTESIGIALAATHLPIGAAFAASAGHGHRSARRCTEAREDFQEAWRRGEVDRAPEPGMPPPARGEEAPRGSSPVADEDVEVRAVDERMEIGAEGGPCTEGGACDEGLACERARHVCLPEHELPPIGAEGGACTAGGACDEGLFCDQERRICTRKHP